MDLFGKKKLEERILELEVELSRLGGEKKDLLRTLEKREERIRKLSAANQEANLDLKAAEQRAASLAASSGAIQDKTEQLAERKPEGRKLGPRDMDLLLERLKSIRSPGEDLVTAFFAGPIPEDARIAGPIKKAAAAANSSRGGIILHCPQLFSLLLIAPFPIKESLFQEGATFYLDPIREMMDTPVLVVSTHAGETYLGVSLSRDGFEYGELVASSVMGKHSKGGWSQKRFERLREEDIKGHIDLVKEKLEALVGRYKPLLHYAVLSGDESLLRQIESSIDLPLLERSLPRHDSRGAGLLLEEIYSFVCYQIDI